MQNFNFNVGTNILFGEGQIANLGALMREYTDRVLLVFGGGSVKRNGVYQKVIDTLQKNGIFSCELWGVEPNPKVSSVKEGVRICRENSLGGVLAVGGGSCIDCAKMIAGSVSYDGDPWDLVTRRAPYGSFLPIFSVLTLAATGSEMDVYSVISNPDTMDKRGTNHPLMLPKISVLDPTCTYSVSAYQTAAGTADIMSHTMETYFTVDTSAFLSDAIAEAILKTCIKYGPVALREPQNYEARANLMWSSTLAINGIIAAGKNKAWSVHGMEHMLSAYYDITHGTGLAILTPAWMEYVLCDETLVRFVQYGINVWDIDPALDKYTIAKTAIAKTREFFISLGLPATLKEAGVGDCHLDEMAERAFGKDGLSNAFMPLSVCDIRNIMKNCMGE